MIGRTILQYELIEKLGAGGMGEIYKALDTRLNRVVAIKVLANTNAGDPDRRRRFIQEAQAASALNHPNIITIHDIVSDQGSQFMVMECVSGKTLAELIPPGGLGVRQCLLYSVQMADALQTAHAAGIIHRDLKPSNVMVTDSGLVKILDFGLAKLSDPAPITLVGDETQTIAAAPMTVEGLIIGTVSYMSPEQAQGKRVDARSDVFSFGVVLYEMLTGRRAFAADSPVSTLSAILRDEVKPISGIVPGIPPELEQIVDKTLRKDPEQRWQSMKEMHTALASLKHKVDSGILQASFSKPKRSRSKLGIAAASVLVLAGAALTEWRISHRGSAPASAPAAPATTPKPLPVEPAATSDGVLTNQGILDMVDAKVSSTLIIEQIRASKTQFNLSTPEIIRLTKAGVPEAVIEAMRNPKRTPTTAVIPKPPPEPEPSVARIMPQIPIPEISRVDVGKLLAGLPVFIVLSEDIPANAEAGRLLRFTVQSAFSVRGGVAIEKGTEVTGALLKTYGGRVSFRLNPVDAVDGTKVKIGTGRAGGAGFSSEVGYFPHSADVAAIKGTVYMAFIDGEQQVAPRRRLMIQGSPLRAPQR